MIRVWREEMRLTMPWTAGEVVTVGVVVTKSSGERSWEVVGSSGEMEELRCTMKAVMRV